MLGILTSVAHNGIEHWILYILEKIAVPINSTLVENCHRLSSKCSSMKVIIKWNCHKDIPNNLVEQKQT